MRIGYIIYISAPLILKALHFALAVCVCVCVCVWYDSHNKQ